MVSDRRLVKALEDCNRELSAVASAIEEDLYEKLISGIHDPLEYREWLEDSLETLCDDLSLSDEACSKLVKRIASSYLQIDASIAVKMFIRYDDLVKVLGEVLGDEALREG